MKKKRKVLLLSILAAVVLLGASFFVYVSTYYRADEAAIALLKNSSITVQGNVTVLRPESPTGTGIIFYPGGKVEHLAYLPLLNQLREEGFTCILVKMPFNLAVFNKNAADAVLKQFPEISDWYMAGHSLGGAMASSYFAENPDKIEGIFLLGSFIYGNVNPADALLVYGTNDTVLDKTKIDPATQNVVAIEGGNHAQFGNYGPQKGDGTPTITPQEQQAITVQAIIAFLAAKGK